MKPAATSFRMFAALWGVLLGPLLPLQAQEFDPAKTLPADTLAYLGWAKLVDQDDAAQSKAFFEQLTGPDLGDPDLQNLTKILELFALVSDKPGSLALLDLTVNEGMPDIQAALFVRAGDDAPQLAESFANLLRAFLPDAEFTPRTVANVELQAIAIPETPLTLVWGVHQGHFLITLGETAAGKIIAGLNGEGSSLADNDEIVFARKKIKATSGEASFSGYGDVRNIVAKAKALADELAGPLPPEVDAVLEALGVNAIRSKYIHCTETERGAWCRIFVHVDGQRKGLLKLWDQKPLVEDDLKLIPKDAYWAQVCNLDLAQLWQDTLATIEEIDPDAVAMVQGAVAMTAGFLGFSITDDLLPAFGDTWALYDARSHGGILLTGSVLVAEVKDRDAVHGMLQRIVEMLKPMLQMNDVNLALRQSTDGDHTIHYAVIGGVPSPVAPAWGFAGDRMVFGLFPQTVTIALNQIDSKTRQASIFDRPDFKKATADILPDEFQSFGFCDSEYFTRLLYPLELIGATLGSSLLSTSDVAPDFNAFPVLAERLKDAHTTFGTCSVDDDGILYAQVGAGSTALIVIAAVALATSIALPSLSRAREQAKRAVSMSRLRAIGTTFHTYTAENEDGRFPEKLEDLLEFIYGEAESRLEDHALFNSPRDREGVVSYVYIAGQSPEGDVRNVLAYERIIGDEGTNVLFLDAHVEWMRLEDFKRALQATYERLGRADEIPDELRP